MNAVSLRMALVVAGATVAVACAACNTPKSEKATTGTTAATTSSTTPAPAATSAAPAPAATGPHVAEVLSVQGELGSGKVAPNFSWKDASGTGHSLKDYAGKVVLINFWGTWCPPCRAELPDIVKLREELAPKGFEVIGINVGERGSPGKTPQEHVAAFAQTNHLSYPLMLGSEDIVTAYGGLEGVPTTFIVDGKGMVISKLVGMQSAEVFRAEIKKAM